MYLRGAVDVVRNFRLLFLYAPPPPPEKFSYLTPPVSRVRNRHVSENLGPVWLVYFFSFFSVQG